MIVRYEPQPRYAVQGWRTGEEREVGAEEGQRLIATGQFVDATPKPKKQKPETQKPEPKETNQKASSDE